ncbi:MAG: DUF1826 domain-containing protein [Planctomycetota bacterium]
MSTTNIRNLSATPGHVPSWNKEAVATFIGGNADVLVLSRNPPVQRNPLEDVDNPLEQLGAAVQAARVRDYAAPVCRKSAGFEVRAGLRELRLNSPELAADLINLSMSFLDQFNVPQASLRIEITRSQSCLKFHCDNVHVRLVTTYIGPTTEYQYAGESMCTRLRRAGWFFLKGTVIRLIMTPCIIALRRCRTT